MTADDAGVAPEQAAVAAIFHETLAAHFVMWHDSDNRRGGEWRCECGVKFGFSDSAIAHVAAALAANLPADDGARAALADAWDEGWQAAWSPLAMHGRNDGPNPYLAMEGGEGP